MTVTLSPAEAYRLYTLQSIPFLARKPLEIIFHAENGFDEALHIILHIEEKYIERYGVYDNVTTEKLGKPGDGTSIDHDEPFVMRC